MILEHRMRFENARLSILKSFRLLPVLLLVFSGWACVAQPSSIPELEGLSPDEAAEAEAFGVLVERLSGAGGYFDTDNLISNESSYLHVIPRLKKLGLSGGAYLGVGPDQNYSYIAHLEPEIAIIVDIRRDNMLTHLLYKALFELSDDRLDFLANLFARYPLKKDVSAPGSVQQLMAAIEGADVLREEQLEKMLAVVRGKIEQSGVNLSEDDLATTRNIHLAFIAEGPGLRFKSHGRTSQSYYPTYKQLATETTVTGENVSFLSDEVYFSRLKEMHEANLIVPVVGNFADDDALPEVGKYLKEIGLEVSAFYTSNVEYYLMSQQQITQFVANVRQMPLKEGSVFIRSYFNRWRSGHPLSIPGYGSTQILQPITTMLELSDPTYQELILTNVFDY